MNTFGDSWKSRVGSKPGHQQLTLLISRRSTDSLASKKIDRIIDLFTFFVSFFICDSPLGLSSSPLARGRDVPIGTEFGRRSRRLSCTDPNLRSPFLPGSVDRRRVCLGFSSSYLSSVQGSENNDQDVDQDARDEQPKERRGRVFRWSTQFVFLLRVSLSPFRLSSRSILSTPTNPTLLNLRSS